MVYLQSIISLLSFPLQGVRPYHCLAVLSPCQVYALIGGFASCAVNLHAKDSSGYRFLADTILQLDKINAQVSGPTLEDKKTTSLMVTLLPDEG